MMTQDDLFNGWAEENKEIKLPTDSLTYDYDAEYIVKVILDPFDNRTSIGVRKSICRFLELMLLADLIQLDQCGCCYSIKGIKKSQRRLRQCVVHMINVIEYALKNGSALFVRIDEEKSSDEQKVLKFANFATTGVSVNIKKLMAVFAEMARFGNIGVRLEI